MSLADMPPLRDALERHDLLARKSFGQHFLLDLNITRKIARLAGIGPDDVVLEVGPGPGGLTRALLETGARVVAIEMDSRFTPILAELAEAAEQRLEVVSGDALKV
ncbi:MAG: 16S rRNA (adenine(1518)-N(6)/adenine(1519)-N(6))-dimethyltransferase, partial [Alphaproteobacteria bacterium]|nr:16S rRNA (adenine(1518)-N(6)/adenine(1519)-N(6))-dimethyltransferase [Alphaproteobacteria bacterium]